jgi:hypothetical protein
MAKNVYDKSRVQLIDGTRLELGPLNIKHLKKFMDVFYLVDFATTEDESISILTECAAICMQQYYPVLQTREDVEDNFDLPTVYRILDICGGVKIDPNKTEEIDDQAKKQAKENKNTWKDLDLAELEAEVFLIGSWKNFEELEYSLTMPELIVILEQKRESEQNDRKFHAAIQGVDLDKHTRQASDPWEEMKSRVFSGGQSSDPNDIISYQGYKAQQAGFGIGMGLDYVDMKKKPEKSD